MPGISGLSEKATENYRKGKLGGREKLNADTNMEAAYRIMSLFNENNEKLLSIETP